jgi:hypothetical protein
MLETIERLRTSPSTRSESGTTSARKMQTMFAKYYTREFVGNVAKVGVISFVFVFCFFCFVFVHRNLRPSVSYVGCIERTMRTTIHKRTFATERTNQEKRIRIRLGRIHVEERMTDSEHRDDDELEHEHAEDDAVQSHFDRREL